MAFYTLAQVISRAGRELSLISADISAPLTSTDANVLQLVALLEGLGQDLARQHPWSQLTAEATVATANGTADYALPSGFLRLVDGTEWNRTQVVPLPNGTSSEKWQELKARTTSGTVYKVARIWANRLHLYPTPTAIESLYYEYRSRFWVQAAAGSTPTLEVPTANDDVLWFDLRLLVAGLKLAFKRAKGFDTTAAQREFDLALAAAQGGDGAAPRLSLNGPGGAENSLITAANAPDAGYG